LPFDILVLVFDICQQRDIVRASRVSRDWRSAALSHDDFYLKLEIYNEETWNISKKLRILREINVPIALDCTACYSPDHTEQTISGWLPVFSTLASRFDIVKRLAMSLKGPQLEAAFRALCACSAPRLRWLSINGRSQAVDWPPLLFNSHAPRLNGLELRSINIPTNSLLAFQYIQQLKMYDVGACETALAQAFLGLRSIKMNDVVLGDGITGTKYPHGISNAVDLSCPPYIECTTQLWGGQLPTLDALTSGFAAPLSLSVEVASRMNAGDKYNLRSEFYDLEDGRVRRIITADDRSWAAHNSITTLRSLSSHIVHLGPISVYCLQNVLDLAFEFPVVARLIVRIDWRHQGQERDLWLMKVAQSSQPPGRAIPSDPPRPRFPALRLLWICSEREPFYQDWTRARVTGAGISLLARSLGLKYLNPLSALRLSRIELVCRNEEKELKHFGFVDRDVSEIHHASWSSW